MLLDKQNNLSHQFPMPVDVTDESSRVTDVTGETVQFVVAATNVNDAGSAAGTVIYARLTNGGVLDAMKARIGHKNNTSFAFVTGTCLSTQRLLNFNVLESAYAENKTLSEVATNVTSGFSNGEFVLDHRTGIIFGKKATTATSDTAGYSYRSSLITSVGGSSGVADDSAFTVGSTTVTPAGFIADETATDSVDEGDIGAARMTLDRKQLMASQYIDDTAFTPGGTSSYVTLIGGQADDTATDSVDEGDVGAVRMSLRRAIFNTLDTLLAGENQSDGVIAISEKPLSTSTYATDLDTSAAAEASSVTKASPGMLYSFTGTNSSGSNRYLQFFNSTTVPADATVPVLSYFCASGGTISDDLPFGRSFTTGISWCWSSTAATKTIGSTDGLVDVRFK